MAGIFRSLLNCKFELGLLRIQTENEQVKRVIGTFYESTLGTFISQYKDTCNFESQFKETLKNLQKIFDSSEFLSEFGQRLQNAIKAYTRNSNDLSMFDYAREAGPMEATFDSVLEHFDLPGLFHFCAQVFFVFVLPNPYFLEVGDPQTQEILPQIEIFNHVLRRKTFYISQLKAAFPKLKFSAFLDITYLKLQQYCEHKLSFWRTFCTSKEYNLSKLKNHNFNNPNKNQKNFEIELIENKKRIKTQHKQTYLINGYITDEKKSSNGFNSCLDIFTDSQVKIVN